MPRIMYKEKKFNTEKMDLIFRINDIVVDYENKGFDMTLRQVYYQLVSQGLIENTMSSYNRIGTLINDARLAGLIDWRHIVDRTRNLQDRFSAKNPKERLEYLSKVYHENYWVGQPHYVEVWVEKEALAGVVERACWPMDVPYFSCRGYTSQSEMWSAAERFRGKNREHSAGSTLIHLGDHDPSGIDMTRDIRERLEMFGAFVDVKRIALNMPQIEHYNPPPNPAKSTDTRFKSYISVYGEESWELDALRPEIIVDLIQDEIMKYRDDDLYQSIKDSEYHEREGIKLVSDYYYGLSEIARELDADDWSSIDEDARYKFDKDIYEEWDGR